MKKTFNINIAGYPFVIDEDAYQLLREYLNTIENAFKATPENSELVTDIEARIAELLLEMAADGNHIITLADVEQIISRIGKPEEMIENEEYISISENGDNSNEEETVVEEEKVSPEPQAPSKTPFTSKKLYRDPINGMLGGVCSGLSWYLGWDVTWIRILVIALTICSFSTVALVYIALWIIVPAAETPLQRMQMMGEEPTVENIGKTVTDTFMDDQGIRESRAKQTSRAPQAANTIATGASWIVKIFIIAGLIIAFPLLIALVLGLVGCIFFLLMWGATLLFGDGLDFGLSNIALIGDQNRVVLSSVICAIGWIITLGVPIGVLVYKGVKPGVKISTPHKRMLIILWIAGFITAALSTGATVSNGMTLEENLRTHRELEYRQREESMSDLDRAERELDKANKKLSKVEKKVLKAQEKFERATEKAARASEKAARDMNTYNSKLEELALKAAAKAEENLKMADAELEKAKKIVEAAKNRVDSLSGTSVTLNL